MDDWTPAFEDVVVVVEVQGFGVALTVCAGYGWREGPVQIIDADGLFLECSICMSIRRRAASPAGGGVDPYLFAQFGGQTQ